MWVLFQVPCPTPDGRTAEDLYQKRVRMISPEMKALVVAENQERALKQRAEYVFRFLLWRLLRLSPPSLREQEPGIARRQHRADHRRPEQPREEAAAIEPGVGDPERGEQSLRGEEIRAPHHP